MDDYIKRSSAIELLIEIPSSMSVCLTKEECLGKSMMKDFAIQKIRNAPAADVRENVHGKWELECEPDGTPYCLHCSVCDQEWARIDIGSFYDYCPYCGADMRGESDG